MDFRRVLLPIAALTFAICGLSKPSDAQTNLIPKPRLKIGAFFPSDGGLRDATNQIWIKVGADIGLPIIGLRAGIDYAFDGSNSIMPITISQIFQPSALVVKSPVYGGIGVGVWNAKVAGVSGSPIGVRGIVGLELAGSLVEANYDLVGKVGGRRLDGLSLLVGKKF